MNNKSILLIIIILTSKSLRALATIVHVFICILIFVQCSKLEKNLNLNLDL